MAWYLVTQEGQLYPLTFTVKLGILLCHVGTVQIFPYVTKLTSRYRS